MVLYSRMKAAIITCGLIIVSITAISLVVFYIPLSNHSGSANFLKGVVIPDNRYLRATVTVNNFKLIADLALNQEQQTKGLAVKDHLNENQGMLFVFQRPSKQSFWMKDMKFPIDIIWLDANRSVVKIMHSLNPCLSDVECPTYAPDKDSLYVLETVAGFSERHNVKTGTAFDINVTG